LKNKNFFLFLFFLTILACSKDDVNRKTNSDRLVFDEIHYANLNQEKKENYLDSIMKLLAVRVNDSKTRNEYIAIAAEYYYLSLTKKSYKASHQALELAIASKDTSLIAKSYYYIGDTFENTNRDSSYFYYLKAEKLYEKIKEFEWFGRMKFNKAYVLF
jgi:hypothetical protein